MQKLIIPAFFLIPSCYYDYRERRIPNEITYVMFITGIIYSLIFRGWSGIAELLYGVGFTVLVLILVGNALKLGAGDIKLMLACSVWLGKYVPYFSFLSLLMVVLYNLTCIAKSGLKGVITAAKMEIFYGHKEPSEKVPGAFFITAGFIISVLCKGML